MPSRNMLVWLGATASAAVVAGASALYWTHPDFLWWNLARARVVASAPAVPKPPALPVAAPPMVQAQPQPPKAPEPAGKPNEAAVAPPPPRPPAFDVVNVDP